MSWKDHLEQDNKQSSGKISYKDFLSNTSNFKTYEDNRAAQREANFKKNEYSLQPLPVQPKPTMQDKKDEAYERTLEASSSPSIANKTFYSNKGTPITFNSKADDKASKAGSVAAGLLDSSTLGIGSKILDKLQPGMTEQARSENPTAFNVGKFAGYIAPATAATKLAKPLLKGITNPLINRVAEGALVGSGMTGIEDTVNGKGLKETLNDVKWNALLGAGLDTALGIPSLVKGIKGVNKNILDNAFNEKFGALKPFETTPIKEVATTKPSFNVSSKYTVKNTTEEQAQKEYDNAIETIHNYFGTNKLTPEEVAQIKPKLGIDLEKLTNDLTSSKSKPIVKDESIYKKYGFDTDVPPVKEPKLRSPEMQNVIDIGNKQKLARISGIGNTSYNPKTEEFSNTLYPQGKPLPKLKPLTKPTLKAIEPPVINKESIVNTNTPLRETKLKTVQNNVPGKSKFVTNSVQNSEVAPQIMKDTIEAPPYIKVNNKDTWHNAVKTVDSNPQIALNEYFNSKELKSADDTALGQALIVKAIKEGRTNDANELSIDLAEKLSRAGQTVQAASIFKRLSPEGMLQYANNVVNRINQVVEKEKGFKDIAGKVKLTDEEANKILEGMKEFQNMPDGDAKDIKIAQVIQIINNKQPSSLVDKIRAVRNIALLGNAKTNVRNVVGNTIMGAADNISNIIGTPIDKLIKLKTGNGSVSLPSATIQAKGFAKGTKSAIQDSFGGIKLSDLKGKTLSEKAKILSDAFANPINRELNGNGKFETGNRLVFDNKPMRIAENLVGTTLKLGDNSFKQAYYDDVLNQLMKSNKVDIATDEMKQIAQKIADERTYQDNNSLTKLAMGVKNLPQKLEDGKLKDATQIFVDSQLPYVKTPANLLKRAIEYTPIGIVDGGAKLNKLFKAGAKSGTYDMGLQREAVDRISRGIVGTGLIGAGAIGAKKGLLTGSAAKDKDMAAFDQQNGKQPYSFKVGDKYYNYDWAQPISMPVSGGVQMTQGKKGQPVNNALDAVSNALTFYSEQPMLQSIQKLVGSPNDSKSIGQRALEAGLQLPNQFVPTALKQLTQMKDDNVRSNYSPNLFERTVTNPIKSKIPGLSNTLPTKIDTLGNEVKQYQGNNNLFNVALNPGNLTTKKNDAAIQMIEDIYNKTGNTIQVPRVAGNTITYTDRNTRKSETIELTGKEIQELQKYIGEKTAIAYKYIAKDYDSSIDSEHANKKAKELQSVLTKIYDEGKLKVLENRGLREYKK